MIEIHDSGVLREELVWSPVYVDALLLRDRDTDADGIVDERVHALHDANFNITAVTDDSGTVLGRFVYDPYGARMTLSSSWGAIAGDYDQDGDVDADDYQMYKAQNGGAIIPGTGADGTGDGAVNLGDYTLWRDNLGSGVVIDFEHGFAGGRMDTITGRIHFRHRDYDPQQMRWNERDPIGFAAGDLSLFRYVGNRPITTLDPAGLADLTFDEIDLIVRSTTPYTIRTDDYLFSDYYYASLVSMNPPTMPYPIDISSTPRSTCDGPAWRAVERPVGWKPSPIIDQIRKDLDDYRRLAKLTYGYQLTAEELKELQRLGNLFGYRTIDWPSSHTPQQFSTYFNGAYELLDRMESAGAYNDRVQAINAFNDVMECIMNRDAARSFNSHLQETAQRNMNHREWLHEQIRIQEAINRVRIQNQIGPGQQPKRPIRGR